jgi:hypothetical protein
MTFPAPAAELLNTGITDSGADTDIESLISRRAVNVVAEKALYLADRTDTRGRRRFRAGGMLVNTEQDAGTGLDIRGSVHRRGLAFTAS